MTLSTLAHLIVALKLNDLVWMVKLMNPLTWMTKLTDAAMFVGRKTQLQDWALCSLQEHYLSK